MVQTETGEVTECVVALNLETPVGIVKGMATGLANVGECMKAEEDGSTPGKPRLVGGLSGSSLTDGTEENTRCVVNLSPETLAGTVRGRATGLANVEGQQSTGAHRKNSDL